MDFNLNYRWKELTSHLYFSFSLSIGATTIILLPHHNILCCRSWCFLRRCKWSSTLCFFEYFNL